MEYKRQNRVLQHYTAGLFIYLMMVPLVILDIFMELYHRICFPLYGIPYVKRSNYIKLDRHKLKYLNLIDKFNCDYCGYANGLLYYASTIAAETEKYWCSIKHEGQKDFKPSPHHSRFLPYGDEQAYKDFIQKKSLDS